MFCKHKWQILSETVTESDFEHTIKILKAPGVSKMKIGEMETSSERKLIQIVSCIKCGKLKRFVTTI